MPIADVVDGYRSLTPDDQAAVKDQIAGLAPPPARYLGAVWIILMSTLCVVVIAGGFLVYQLIQDGKESAVIVGFVSGALGALIGLLAPSPKP